MRRLLIPAFVLATFGCHSGTTLPDGASGGAGRGDAAVGDAPGGSDDVAEQSDVGGQSGASGNGGSGWIDGAAACFPLFHDCALDTECCGPNRCLNITGTRKCQVEGPQMTDAGSGDVAATCVSYGQACSETHHCCGGLICAGSCSMGVSDRNLKHDFAPVDDDEILKSLVALPISTWRYKTDYTSARHIGPTAQDFRSAFHVGSTDKLIYQVDGDGVAFAAIKSLNTRLNRVAHENAALHRELSRVRAELHDLGAKHH
jgi:hypothetical protein